MVKLNAVENKTYQQIASIIGNLPQGSTFQVRDLFHNHLGQPSNPRIARRLFEEAVGSSTLGAAGATVKLQPIGQRSRDGYIVQ